MDLKINDTFRIEKHRLTESYAMYTDIKFYMRAPL